MSACTLAPKKPLDNALSAAHIAVMAKTVGAAIEREAEGIECPACHGYAERVEPTDDESQEYGCGRRRCCARAFVCKVCSERWVGSADAPEME